MLFAAETTLVYDVAVAGVVVAAGEVGHESSGGDAVDTESCSDEDIVTKSGRDKTSTNESAPHQQSIRVQIGRRFVGRGTATITLLTGVPVATAPLVNDLTAYTAIVLVVVMSSAIFYDVTPAVAFAPFSDVAVPRAPDTCYG